MSAPAWKGWIVGEYGSFAQAQTDAEIEQYIRNTSATVDHISGTVAMGKTGSTGNGTGALNSDLTVKGTVGLRVVDASVFVSIYYLLFFLETVSQCLLQPFVTAANTQAPVYAVAERAADLIKQAWGSNNSTY